MSIVSSTGIGSGIDIGSLVSQLVAAEGQPEFNAIQRQQDAVNTRLSGIGSLKSAMADFQTALSKLKDGSAFKAYKVASADETVVKASVGAGVAAASYGIEVTQLAKAQKSITGAEFADAAATVGTGSLTLASGSNSFTLNVVAGSNSLTNLRDAINGAAGNSFVTASIVNVDSGSSGTISKLVLTARNTGSSNAFTVTGSDDDGLDDASGLSRLFSTQLSVQTAAADAIVKVDGQTATRSSNTIGDVLQGVTLNLQAAKPGTTVNVNVSQDGDAINAALNNFVSAYNKFHTVTDNLGKYGGNSDGSGNGALIGDATLRYATARVRQGASDVVTGVSSNYNSLAMVGISINKDGVMSLDSSRLTTVLSAEPQAVANLFSASDGVAVRLNDRLTGFLQSGGPLDSQQTSLNQQLSALKDRRSDVQSRLDTLQKTLQKQFTAMDVAVGQFKSTGVFLNNWINTL